MKNIKKILFIGFLLLSFIFTYFEKEDNNSLENTIIEVTQTISIDGHYTQKEDVAEYIWEYHKLPENFINKSEAKKLGWIEEKGNLAEVAEGKSIGGDVYKNYELLLPDNMYYECDINYNGGFRGKERLVFTYDGLIYYTSDHYKNFTKLERQE